MGWEGLDSLRVPWVPLTVPVILLWAVRPARRVTTVTFYSPHKLRVLPFHPLQIYRNTEGGLKLA